MSDNPYAAPSAPVADAAPEPESIEYIGFWLRVVAAVIDSVLTVVITVPILMLVYPNFLDSESMMQGWADFFVSYVFPFVAVMLFWVYRQATPGKMAVSAVIVDAQTGGKPSTGQFIGRYFAYIPSVLVLGLGILWVAFDPRKQGWHDKLAGTLVVRKRK